VEYPPLSPVRAGFDVQNSDPAVIHCWRVVMRPPPRANPDAQAPSIMYVTFRTRVRMPVVPSARPLVFDFAHLVHVDERVESAALTRERAHTETLAS